MLTLRYSVHLVGDTEGWYEQRRIAPEHYPEYLFSDDRLRDRLRFFTGILLPSLLAQRLPMRRGLRELSVYVSEGMPEPHLAALRSAVSALDWVRIVMMPMGATEYPDIGPAIPHAHLRIDDDDALSRDFLSRLSAYVRPECHGHIITHPTGYFAGYDEAGRLLLKRVWIPMIAMGIAYIVAPGTRFRSIYAVGPHFDAYRAAPTIIGDGRPAYVRTVHPGQSMYPMTKFRGDPRLRLAEIRRHIEFDPEALRPA